MLELGTDAPDFNLPNIDGNMVKRDDFTDAKALLVVFMCNHCPYVKHVRKHFTGLVKEYQDTGVAVVGINANDADQYPDDSPEQMKQIARELGYTFPYLYDKSQEIAKTYRAACTPDFFLFKPDSGSRFNLFYRGQMDSSRPGNDIPITGEDLRSAIDALLAGESPPDVQKPSLGCNIKWKPGNEPEYFG
jgi:peroxiredoxin